MIPDGSGPDHWWTDSTYVENGVQLVFVNEFGPASGGALAQFTGRSGIAVMSIPAEAPTLQSVVPLPTDPDTQWGQAVVQSGPYLYVYGLDMDHSSGTYEGMKIARVPQGQSVDTSAWAYWDDTGWVAGEQNAVAVNTGSILTGETPQAGGSGFVAVSIPGGVFDGSTVALSYACAPTGPWTQPQPVYTIPQIAEYPGEVAYTPTVHPELSQSGLVVSYNINNTDSASVLQDDHEYQPQFLMLND